MKSLGRQFIRMICIGATVITLCAAPLVSQNPGTAESISGFKIALQDCSVNAAGGLMTMTCAGSLDLSPVFGAGAVLKADKFVFDSSGNVTVTANTPMAVKFGKYNAATAPGEIIYKADSSNKSFPLNITITFPVGGKEMKVDAKLSLAAGSVLDTNIALNPPAGQPFLNKEKTGTIETTYISGNLQVKNRAIGELELKKESRDLGVCGDGKVVSPEEQCDDGTKNTDKTCAAAYGSSCKYCTTECKAVTVKGAFCGDGIITDDVNGDGKVDNKEPEECDDANTKDYDGCSPKCANDEYQNSRLLPINAEKQSVTTAIWNRDVDFYKFNYIKKKYAALNLKTPAHTYIVMDIFFGAYSDANRYTIQKGYGDQAGGLNFEMEDAYNTGIVYIKITSDGVSEGLYTLEYSMGEARCGNGTLDKKEECDDGAKNDKVCSADYNTSCEYCDGNCRKRGVTGPYCGDNVKNGTEECDDANKKNFDGCSTECKKQENCRGIINDWSSMESRNAGVAKCVANPECAVHEGNCIGRSELSCKMIKSILKCTSFDNKCKWDFGLDMCVDGKPVCEDIKPAGLNYSNQTNCEHVAGCGLFMSGIEKNTVSTAKCVTCASITKKEDCLKNPRDGYQYGCGWNTNTQKCEACSKVDMEMKNQQNLCNAIDGCGWLLGDNACKSCTVIGFRENDRATANCNDAPNCTYVQPYQDAYINNKNNLGCQPKSTIKK